MSFTPTSEQWDIMEAAEELAAEQRPNRRLKINAGAGAAKTTTMSLVSQRLQVTSLYLAFNKSMAEEAKNKFPQWVVKKTTHGLAYGVFGAKLSEKLRRPKGGYVNVLGTGAEIARYFKIASMESDMGITVTASSIGQAIRDTVNRFEYSADEELEVKHISYMPLAKLSEKDRLDLPYYEALVLRYAKALWKKRIDPNEQTLINHDTYLKLYQLSKPDLSQYKVIYLDEAQDTNDCVLDIVLRQQDCLLVMVGDPRQQIYSFRGSVNAMAKIKAPECKLTTSFRFGEKVAEVANIILQNSKAQALHGWEKLESKVWESNGFLADGDAEGVPEIPEQHARLYRTNAALVWDAVNLIGQGKSVRLEIDTRDFIRLLESATALYQGDEKKVKHENILCYTSWQEFRDEYAESPGELGRVCRIIEGDDQWKIFKALRDHENDPSADIVLTTAHKSKGREFDVVVLADDYPSGYDDKKRWVGLNEMEQNLLYVAATRCKKHLYGNTTLDNIMVETRAMWLEAKEGE
ncbi:DNA helicase [Pseudomonas phage vB_PaeM_G1]|uniref:DNA 3'-5' helicase n=1 Tax=Pseudomonas phage vB_PaeM_G1 TaxID=1983539 RepID=A0A218L3U4_9CAUD|nr:DNA helicase [Pseudomonas phage vB_PaeM_G1]ARW57300.1 putative helicase [Pseudomonas phage vB_PaeM_G1]